MEYLGWILGIGMISLVMGIFFLYKANQVDQENYILEKATPMPLSLVNVWDDVWLSGQAVCDAPLSTPHFGTSCLYYLYTLEEKVKKTYRDSNGNLQVHYVWEQRDRKEKATLFHLTQGDLSIEIDGKQAEFRHLRTETITVGKWRHTANYYPYPGTVNAIGSVGEGRKRLLPFANIPLIVTSLNRQAFIESVESQERWMRRGGFFLLWAGSILSLYGVFDWMQYPVPTYGRFSTPTLIYAFIPSTFFFILYWLIYTYNQIVSYKMRIENAWRQVDVDLKMRYDLIPNLVSTVKGYMKYEKKLLEDIANLRNQAIQKNRDGKIEVEEEMLKGMKTLFAKVEKYPEIKANPLVQKVMRELQGIEEKISHGRSIYNESVKEFNNLIMAFPHSLVAAMIGYGPQKYFTATEEEKKAKTIHLSSKERENR